MIDITYNFRSSNIEIRFYKDPDLILLVKRIPGREYHVDRYWFVPVVQGRDIKPYLERFIKEAKSAGHDSEVDPLVWDAIEEAANYKTLNLALSTADDYTDDPRLTSTFGRDLTGLQRARIRYLFNNAGGVLWGSADRVIPLATVEYGLFLPALVVCADTEKFLFASEFKRMTRRQVFVMDEEQMLIKEAREAATGRPEFAELCVVNYGLLPKFREWLTTIEWQVMILDRAHCIRNGNSEQGKILLDMARWVPRKILMSCTDFRVAPWELCTQLEIAGRMEDFGGRQKFLEDYTNITSLKHNGSIDHWKARNTERLESELRSVCYTR